jgi:transposase
MRYELSDEEWTAIRPMLPNKPRCVPRVNDPSRPQWYLLGFAIRGAMARPASGIRSLHDLLQPLCSLAANWCLGLHHRRTCRCP